MGRLVGEADVGGGRLVGERVPAATATATASARGKIPICAGRWWWWNNFHHMKAVTKAAFVVVHLGCHARCGMLQLSAAVHAGRWCTTAGAIIVIVVVVITKAATN